MEPCPRLGTGPAKDTPLESGGVCHFGNAQPADQHKECPTPEIALMWHESGGTRQHLRADVVKLRDVSAIDKLDTCHARDLKGSHGEAVLIVADGEVAECAGHEAVRIRS